jgi:SAM-dependent methyltransferase
MDILEHNRRAWDRQAEHGNQWTMPVSPDAIAAARRGEWSIVLTPVKPVPHEWLPDLAGKRVLCLASGGGQQGPVLAAAGAQVTVLDNSSNQLERDRFVAEREQLEITTVRGDMADLSMFPGESFDCIVHPVSNLFAPNVLPVWREAFRVLRKGGVMVAGFNNPAVYLFEYDAVERTGSLEVKYTLPYSDIEHLTEEQQRRWAEAGRPLEFSHTLEDQIGGQIAAGFVITGFYEDRDPDEQDNPLSKFMPVFIATRALKP